MVEIVGFVTPRWNWANLGEQKVNERHPMNDTSMTSNLVQTWVPVIDAQGRTRLEARWTAPVQTDTPAHVVHAPHAA